MSNSVSVTRTAETVRTPIDVKKPLVLWTMTTMAGFNFYPQTSK